MKLIGIYKITNLVNGKIYIGQSCDIETRLKSHKSCSTNEHLRNSIRLYGVDNFKFEVLEETSTDTINERERFWISYYDCTNPEKGYNLTSGGERDGGWHHSEQSKQKMSDIAREYASRPEYVNPAAGTVLIHKGSTTSRCKHDELEYYKQNGWESGPSEKFVKDGASKRCGENNGVYGKGYLFSGSKNHFYGKHHTEETKQKIRENMPDTTHGWKGHKHSEESKEKMRGARPSVTGEKNPNYGKRGKDAVMYGRKVIHKGDVEKRVPKSELDKYLADGWVLGVKPSTIQVLSENGKAHMQKLLNSGFDTSVFASNVGKKLISKSGVRKFVKIEEMDNYIKDGWKLGGKS